MPNLKGSFICKALALVLCLFLAFEVSYIQAYQATDQMREQFKSAKEAYLTDDFDGAKNTLESLVSSIAQLEGMDSFKGEVYLLLGAAYEKLELNNLAIKYYCLAKDILGEGKTIPLDDEKELDLNSLPLYWAECMTAAGVAISVLIMQFEEGHALYLAGDYEGAKVIMENQIAVIDRLKGFDSLKGESYLLIGAIYEELKYKELSIKYFCLAINILGLSKTIDGLVLRKYKYYGNKWCQAAGATAGRVVVRERRRGGSGFIGFILGLAVLGGLIWYLFINENSPLKKDKATAYSSACFTTQWAWSTWSHWYGDLGNIDIDPDPLQTFPWPKESNDWSAEQAYTWTATGGGTLEDWWTKISLTVGGGDNVRRHDKVWFDGVVVFDQQHTFTQPCSANEKKEYKDIIVVTTLGGHTLKYEVTFTDLAGNIIYHDISTTSIVNIKNK